MTDTKNRTEVSMGGFKETEIGPLPAEWEVGQLGQVVVYRKGRKPEILQDRLQQGSLPYLTANYFRTGTASQFVPRREIQRNVVCRASDVVLIWDGSNAGDVFIGLEGIVASTMVMVTPISPQEVDGQWVYFFLKTQFEKLNCQTQDRLYLT